MTSDFLKNKVFPFMREEVYKHVKSFQTDLAIDVETLMELENEGFLTVAVWFVREHGTNLLVKKDEETFEEFNDRALKTHAILKDSIVHEYSINFELERIEKVGA